MFSCLGEEVSKWKASFKWLSYFWLMDVRMSSTPVFSPNMWARHTALTDYKYCTAMGACFRHILVLNQIQCCKRIIIKCFIWGGINMKIFFAHLSCLAGVLSWEAPALWNHFSWQIVLRKDSKCLSLAASNIIRWSYIQQDLKLNIKI